MNTRFRRYGSGNPRRLLCLRTDQSSGTRKSDPSPIVAVESRDGGCEPRHPDPFEVYDHEFYFREDEDLEEHLLDRESKVDYTRIAHRVIFEGYFPFFEFLRVEVQPADADFQKHPYGGFPPEAFHHGVTQEVLKSRHAGVLAAMVRLGLLALSETTRRKLGTVQQEADLALAAVIRSWERAFAEQKPLPPGTPEYYRRGQFWLPPHIYTRPANKSALVCANTADDWS